MDILHLAAPCRNVPVTFTLAFMGSTHRHLLAAWKWLASFRKRDWDFEDYPVYVRRNDVPDPACAWAAQIANWPGPIGLGPDPQGAVGDLKKNFGEIAANFKRDGEALIRPGVPQPVRFAIADRIEEHGTLMEEFTRHVLGMDPNQLLFVSDQSSLHDFGDEAEVERMQGLIRSVFQVEASDIVDGNIATILKRIEARRNEG